MKKLVTGATGFIGSAIMRELIQDGEEVKVLVRPTSNTRNIDAFDVEKVVGDIRDGESMKAAMKGCDTLYFTAAYFAHWAPNPRMLYEVNAGGTKATLQAALETGIERVVYTSTNNAIGASGPTPANEEKIFNYWESGDHYSMSKYIAENEARIFITRGVPVVIVNPTLVIGVNDVKPTPSGQMIIDVARQNMPGYIDGGVNLIDVEDVAKGHILAAKKGRVGERYLFGNRNITVQDYLFLIANIAGVKPPSLKLPYPVALTLGHLFELTSSITKKSPMVTASEVRIGRMREWYDCSKAINELGLPQTPIEETIQKALNWFKENGYLKG
ncbi:MAG: NAD-dependent epimerase/dehydratase family protein [Anaerolineaceae bacterium]|nr:NAD-dependent epimerase/dehydratase family protein [Anaerolineaceae bacterium]